MGAQIALQSAQAGNSQVLSGGSGGSSPYPAVEYADGGKVRGPGGPTEDKVGPVMLSDGEYVLPADTVEAIGKENLDKLRAATHDFDSTEDAEGLAGLVQILLANSFHGVCREDVLPVTEHHRTDLVLGRSAGATDLAPVSILDRRIRRTTAGATAQHLGVSGLRTLQRDLRAHTRLQRGYRRRIGAQRRSNRRRGG
jgi:hypothetical protein